MWMTCGGLSLSEDFPEVLGPINIGSSQEVTIRELAETVREVVGILWVEL